MLSLTKSPLFPFSFQLSFLLLEFLAEDLIKGIAKAELPFRVGLVEVLHVLFLAPSEVDFVFPFQLEQSVELEVVDCAVQEGGAPSFHFLPAGGFLVGFLLRVELLVLPLVFLLVDDGLGHTFRKSLLLRHNQFISLICLV